MFASLYEEDDTTAQSRLLGKRDEVDGRVPHVLVADSDNDDSLGAPPLPGATLPVAVTRAFSKRAAGCAAELLGHCDVAASPAQRTRCMQQLRRLGGPYRSLGQGQSPTLWLCTADLNARAIVETEAYFNGRLRERLGTPQVSRHNGSLTAPFKEAVRLQSGDAPCGVRVPLPASHRTDNESFALSRGEQFALSLLSIEESAVPHNLPTYVLHKDQGGGLVRTSLSGPAVGVTSGVAAYKVFTSGTTDGCDVSLPPPCWVYGESENGRSSTLSSPSAAHSSDSPGAASAPRKRSRVVDEEVVSMPHCSATLPQRATPRSLSATVIEEQNHRAQWHLLRHQTLFSPF